jgi:hypothetical protein
MSDKNIKKQDEESVSSGIIFLVAVIVICMVIFVLKVAGIF